MKHRIIIFSLAIIFSLKMLGSGWFTENGLILRGENSADGIWNIALIHELMNHFPPDHPGFAELPLKGYHFMYHLLLAIVSKITYIPAMFLYFQIFPLIISYLWGLGVFKTVFLLTKNKTSSYISVLCSYFGGSFAFLFRFVGQGEISIDSGFGISQPYSSSLVNPAYASSIVIMIWAIYSYFQYTKEESKKWLFYLTILSGISVGFKVYAGMILMGALFVASIWRLLFEKKIDLGISFLGALGISLVVFYPFNGNYGFLVYAPFLHIIRMIEGPFSFTSWDDLFHIQREIHNYFGMTKLFLMTFIIFLIGNIGIRIIGINGYIKIMKKQLTSTHLYILLLILIALGIPLFFIQPAGGAFNINQMHWYFLFLLSLFVGPGIVDLLKRISRKEFRYGIGLIVIFLSLPTFLVSFKANISPSGVAIYASTVEMMVSLKQFGNYNDTVFIIPKLDTFEEFNIENWFWKDSNVIIPALGSKRVYLSSEAVPYFYEERFERYKLYETLEAVRKSCEDKKKIQSLCIPILNQFINSLTTKKIKLLYVEKPFNFPEHPQLRQINSNTIATIYEVLPL